MSNNLEKTFIDLGYTKEEYRHIRSYGLLLLYSDTKIKENLNDGILFFSQLGFAYEQILKFYKYAPNILKYSYDELYNQINKLIILGYNQDEILKMIKVDSRIITLSDDDINNRFYYLNRFGYTNEDILKIGKRTPQIFTENVKNLNDKFYFLLEHGYKKEDIVKMTNKLSSIFSYSLDNLQNKIDFFDFINAHELPVIKPNILMQSSKVSYARYYYFIDKNINFEVNNYRKLFISENQFKRAYGISTEELIKIYESTLNSKQKSIN